MPSFIPIDSIENHTFLKSPLRNSTQVLDLGANIGTFGREITRRYGVSCLSIEPNPKLFAKLEGHERLRFFNFAISGEEGEADFSVSSEITASTLKQSNNSRTVGTVRVATRTLAGFLEGVGVDRLALMKVDIEGSEVELFATTSDDLLRSIDQITIEFHDDHGLMTKEQFRDIHRRLHHLGFRGVQFAGNNTNWLYFQPQIVQVGAIEDAYLRYIVRNVRGVGRKLGIRLS